MDGCSRSFAPFYRCPCIIQQQSDSTSTKSLLLLLLLLIIIIIIIIIIIHKSPWSPFRQPRRQGSWSLLTAFGRILCITLLGALLGAVLGAGLSWDPEIRQEDKGSSTATRGMRGNLSLVEWTDDVPAIYFGLFRIFQQNMKA